MFFATKEQWYSLVTKTQDVDLGYRRLDAFFKSVGVLMSNQLCALMDASLAHLEGYFAQFASYNSDISLFSVRLTVSGSQIKFEPPLPDFETLIVSVLDEMVAVTKEIPRVETRLFTSLANEHLYLTSRTLEDDRIAEGRYIRNIISKNGITPQKHLMSYDKYKTLLTHKSEKRIEEFLREKHELEEYEEEIQKLLKTVSEINASPSAVRLSLYYLECDTLKAELVQKANSLIQKLVDQIADVNRKTNLR